MTTVGSEERRMTRIIEFTRQLWPMPPKDARPYFCLLKTLIFYDGDGNNVWEQRIPEADQIFSRQVGPRIYGVHVELDEYWGWLLKFRMTHEDAMKLWGYAFQGFRRREHEVSEIWWWANERCGVAEFFDALDAEVEA